MWQYDKILVYGSSVFAKSFLDPFLPDLTLPNDNFLYLTKFKTFADDKLNITRIMISVFDKIETLWEKGKMLVNSIFSFSNNVSKRVLHQGRNKLALCSKVLIVERLYKRSSIVQMVLGCIL